MCAQKRNGPRGPFFSAYPMTLWFTEPKRVFAGTQVRFLRIARDVGEATMEVIRVANQAIPVAFLPERTTQSGAAVDNAGGPAFPTLHDGFQKPVLIEPHYPMNMGRS